FQLSEIGGRIILRPATTGWFLKSVTLNNEDVTDSPFEVKTGSSTTGFEVVLTDKQSMLSGVAKSASGTAVKDYVAIILPSEPKDGLAAARFIRAARPDTNGKYQARGLPPGNYVGVAVESLDQGAEWDPAFQQMVKPRGKAFTLGEGQTLEFDLPV